MNKIVQSVERQLNSSIRRYKKELNSEVAAYGDVVKGDFTFTARLWSIYSPGRASVSKGLPSLKDAICAAMGSPGMRRQIIKRQNLYGDVEYWIRTGLSVKLVTKSGKIVWVTHRIKTWWPYVTTALKKILKEG